MRTGGGLTKAFKPPLGKGMASTSMKENVKVEIKQEGEEDQDEDEGQSTRQFPQKITNIRKRLELEDEDEYDRDDEEALEDGKFPQGEEKPDSKRAESGPVTID